MVTVRSRLCAVRGSDIHSGKMRHSQNGFHRGHGYPHDHCADFCVGHGVCGRLAGDDCQHPGQKSGIPGAVGSGYGCQLAVLFYALQRGPIDKVVPIDKSSTVMTILLAALLLGESVTLTRGIGVVLIAAGTFLMIEKKGGVQKEENGWMVAAFGSAIFAALTSILGKVGITGVESNLGTALRTGVVLIMAWVMVFVQGKQGQVKAVPKNELGFICLSGLATGASWLCYYKALQLGPASLVAPIDKLSILVTVLFSYIVFHERLSRKALTGLAGLVAGTLVMLV